MCPSALIFSIPGNPREFFPAVLFATMFKFLCLILPACGTRWTKIFAVTGEGDKSYLINIVLFCENAEWRMPIVVFGTVSCITETRLTCWWFRMSWFVGLGVQSRSSPFLFPRVWSTCLNAHWVPLEHEPSDDHCLQSPRFPSPLFFKSATGMPLSCTPPLSF